MQRCQRVDGLFWSYCVVHEQCVVSGSSIDAAWWKIVPACQTETNRVMGKLQCTSSTAAAGWIKWAVCDQVNKITVGASRTLKHTNAHARTHTSLFLFTLHSVVRRKANLPFLPPHCRPPVRNRAAPSLKPSSHVCPQHKYTIYLASAKKTKNKQKTTLKFFF